MFIKDDDNVIIAEVKLWAGCTSGALVNCLGTEKEQHTYTLQVAPQAKNKPHTVSEINSDPILITVVGSSGCE